MNETIDINELEQQSTRDRVVRERIETIVDTFRSVVNRGKKHHLHYDYRIHDIKDGKIEITMEESCGSDGSIDIDTLTIPATLLNATKEEWVSWFEERARQFTLRYDIVKKEKSIDYFDHELNALLVAFGHLQDQGWIHAKIVEINGVINETSRKKDACHEEIARLLVQVNPEHGALRDGEFSRPRHVSRSGISLFAEASWRDLCSDVKKDDGENASNVE